MKYWYKRLYNWSLKWANTKWGNLALFICAFADASFLPLPTPMLFLALALLNIAKSYNYALLGTIGTFSGAVLGYSIGHLAWLYSNGDFTGLAQFLFNHIPGFSEANYIKIQTQFIKWDFWILFIAPLIPIPYKFFSISSGVFDINFFMFSAATLISQGLRFYLFAFLVIKLGPEVKKVLEGMIKPLAIIATTIIAIAFIAIKFF